MEFVYQRIFLHAAIWTVIYLFMKEDHQNVHGELTHE